MLIGLAPLVGGDARPAVTIGTPAAVVNNSNLTTYTLSSVAIGAAAPDRLVCAFIHAANGPPVQSVTIGGVAAVLATPSGTAGFWLARVPTGTTATIVATLSSGITPTSLAAIVWPAYNVAGVIAAPYAFQAASHTALSVSAEVPAGGAALFAHICYGTGGSTWSGGVVERVDRVDEVDVHRSAADLVAADLTGFTASAAYGASTFGELSGIVLR